MRIMVTGGWGFLGSHVSQELRLADHHVFPLRHSDYDLTLREDCAKAIRDTRPEVVIHLAAAVGGIGANLAHPGQFLYDNAVMGLELMDQAYRLGVRKFVSVGTACEYPADAPLPLREQDIWDGYPAPETAPYGLAKRMLLAQGQFYRKEYGFDAIHLIPSNLYGPGDHFDPETSHVIPGLIQRFSRAVKENIPAVQCWGTGRATREFLYVGDAAAAIVMAAERYESLHPMNIGTGVETPVASVAEEIAGLYGYTGEIKWDATRSDGVSRRQLDTSRAWRNLGFAATTSLSGGLKTTVDWYEGQA